jgi:hypothetical protein
VANITNRFLSQAIRKSFLSSFIASYSVTPENSICELKRSGKFGKCAKMHPAQTNGYENDKATEFFRQI